MQTSPEIANVVPHTSSIDGLIVHSPTTLSTCLPTEEKSPTFWSGVSLLPACLPFPFARQVHKP